MTNSNDKRVDDAIPLTSDAVPMTYAFRARDTPQTWRMKYDVYAINVPISGRPPGTGAPACEIRPHTDTASVVGD